MGTSCFIPLFIILVAVLITSLTRASNEQVEKGPANLATKSLQIQSQIFRSVILNYLSRPDDELQAAEDADESSADPADNETEGKGDGERSASPSHPTAFDDSSIHLRVLRSADRHPQHQPHHHRRHPQHGSHPRNSHQSSVEHQSFSLRSDQNQISSDEFGEETMAAIEVIQTRTPFNVTDGQLIMRDLPMVERRSIPQFGGMVILYTRKNPLRLLYYGNWCGSGGMGPPLDEIDKCCMTHDKCYGAAERQVCSNMLFQKPYTVHYAWRWIEEHKQAVCLRTGDRCAELTCECDRKAAACFSKHMIDAKLQGNRLRRNRKRFHPLRAH